MAKPSEIAVLLSLKDKDFRTGMQRARSSLSELGGAAASVGSAMGVLLPAATLAGMAAFIKSSVDAAHKLDDLNKSTGVSVETLAGLQLAAIKGGADLDTAARAIQRFSSLVLDAANNGGQAAEKLARYGLNVEKLKTQTPEQQFFSLAEALEQIGDNDRPAVLIDLLGQRMAGIAPLFADGSAALREWIEEGKRLNPVTSEMAAQAGEFNDRLDEMKAATQGLGTALARDALPWMTEVARATATAAEESGLLMAGWVALGGLGKAIFTDEFINKQKKLVTLRDQLARAEGGFITSDDQAKRLREEIELLEAEVKAEQDAAAAKIKAANDESAAKAVKADADRRRFEEAKTQRAEDQKGVNEQISDARRLRDALVKAYDDAGKTARDYFAQAQALRDRANTAAAADADDVEAQAAATLDLLAAEMKLQRIRATAPLEDVQRQAELVRQLSERIGDQARATEAKKNADLAEADALDRAGNAELERQKGLAEQQKQNDQRLAEFVAKLKELEKGIVIPVSLDTSKAESQISELAGTRAPAPGYAVGGAIHGPGTGRSDSILARVSNGEHVLTAQEVAAAGGHAAIYRLRAMLRQGAIPGFADGGAIERLSLPSVPAASSGPTNIINLTLPGGESFELQAQESVARALQRTVGRASIMHGRRK